MEVRRALAIECETRERKVESFERSQMIKDRQEII